MTILEDASTQESRSRERLRREFRDEDYRYAYAEDFLDTWIATQLVTLREQRGLSQTELGALIGTKQSGVSRLENANHSTWRTATLRKAARALGVRLKITFETFGTLVDEDAHFSREYLERPKFEDDPVFKAPASGRDTEQRITCKQNGVEEMTKRKGVVHAPRRRLGFEYSGIGRAAPGRALFAVGSAVGRSQLGGGRL